MSAVDTSVVVPALLSWHEHHDSCAAAASGAVIPAHAILESYSVMTRLPAPHRVDPALASSLLGRWFPPEKVVVAPAGMQRRLVGLVVAAGVDGGAVYDALVGMTAAHHGEELMTRDRRALATYDALGVAHRLLDAAT